MIQAVDGVTFRKKSGHVALNGEGKKLDQGEHTTKGYMKAP